MADEATPPGGGFNEDSFTDLDLDGIGAVIDADYARVPTLRKQAEAYRTLLEVADRHRSGFSGRFTDAFISWSSKGASGFGTEREHIDDSFRRGSQSISGNADALDRIADEVEATKSKVDQVRAEWADLETQYQTNPHLFDGYAADGGSGYQAAKTSYVQEARTCMHGMSVSTTQTWYTSMHQPGDYKGPTYAKAPERTLVPSNGTTGGNGNGTSTGNTYTPGSVESRSPSGPGLSSNTPTPGPAPSDMPPEGPRTEFPSPVTTAPGPAGPVIGGPGPVGPGGGLPVNPGGTVSPVYPGTGYGPRPGVIGPSRPAISGGAGTGAPPRTGTPTTRPLGNGRVSPSRFGQRPGSTGQAPTRASQNKPPTPERGVIRNPRQAKAAAETEAANRNAPGGRNNKRRRDEENDPIYGDGGHTDELFAGLNLNASPDVIGPELQAPPVTRRQTGPVLSHRDIPAAYGTDRAYLTPAPETPRVAEPEPDRVPATVDTAQETREEPPTDSPPLSLAEIAAATGGMSPEEIRRFLAIEDRKRAHPGAVE